MDVNEPSAKYLAERTRSAWSLQPLANLYAFQNGLNAERSSYGSGTPFVNVLEITKRSHLKTRDIPGRVNVPAAVAARYAVAGGDVVFNRTSETQDEVGLASVYVDNEPVLFGGFVIRARPLGDRLLPGFAAYALRSPPVRKQITASGQGAVRANVGQQDLGRVLLSVPPRVEQKNIAATIDDCGALVDALEQLIAKKRQIKQGAMQELLTGKKRLPGFDAAWTSVTLGEIARIKTGSRNNQDHVDDGLYPFFVRSNVIERINTYSYDCEAILVPGEGNIGSIFHYIVGRFDVHQRVYAITDFRAGVVCRFVFFLMAQFFGRHAMQNTVKATVDSLRLPTFTSFEIRIPPTAEEQVAVVEVLADLDAELTALETKLAKARALKQGISEALLTGRIRLVPPAPQAAAA